MSLHSFKDYIAHEQDLLRPYFFTKRRDISIHWADFKEGLELKKRSIDSVFFEREIHYLKHQPIYYRSNTNPTLYEMSLYEYYHNICYPLNMENGVDKYSFSLDGDIFTPGFMRPEWFNEKDFYFVVYNSIYQGYIPVRDIRLYMDWSIDVRLGYKSTILEDMIHLRQVTKDGLLCQCSEETFEKLIQSQWMDICVDLNPIYELRHQNKNWFDDECDSLSSKSSHERFKSQDGYSLRIHPNDISLCKGSACLEDDRHDREISFFISYAGCESDDVINVDSVKVKYIKEALENIKKQVGQKSLSRLAA